jgi:hypothetical protein
MKKLLSKLSVIFLLIFVSLSLPIQVMAVCPVCTVAVGAGLGVTRWLGIDDTIAGLWIGGLVLSSALWLANWAKSKSWNLPKKEWLAGSFLYVLLISTLYFLGIAGNPVNKIFGIDKIIFGIAIGTALFAGSVKVDQYLRSINDDQVFIYYQKVILPMLFLSIVSAILHFSIN